MKMKQECENQLFDRLKIPIKKPSLRKNESSMNPTFHYVAETFGFIHHEGTDPELELEVLKCILKREGLVSKLREIVKRIYLKPQIDLSFKICAQRVNGSSSSKKDLKTQVLILLTECREGL